MAGECDKGVWIFVNILGYFWFLWEIEKSDNPRKPRTPKWIEILLSQLFRPHLTLVRAFFLKIQFRLHKISLSWIKSYSDLI